MASKLKKTALGLLAVLAVLIVALVCITLFWLGPTVKMAAEKIGSKALGTPLTIHELTINPRDGTFHMTGFAIANHDAYDRTNAVSLASLDIAINMASLFSPTVLIHRVQIDQPSFVYELNTASDNIAEFIRNINAYMGPKEVQPEESEAARDKDQSNPKIVLVEQLEINDVQFHLANTDDPSLDIEAGFEQLTASLTNGTLLLRKLYVSNPENLQTPHLFTLDEVAVRLDQKSLYTDTLSIHDIQVTRPYVYLEQKPTTDTVAEFMRLAQRLANRSAITNAPPESPSPQADKNPGTKPEAPPLQLHNLAIDDIQLKLSNYTTTNATTEPVMLAGIGSISVKLVDGKIQVRGIQIPNPAGYTNPNLFQLETIDVLLDPSSVFSDQVQIMGVLIDSPEIHLEQTELSGNIADLQTIMMGFAPPVVTAEGAPTPETVPTAGERPEPIPLDQQPVALDSLEITNFAVYLTLPPFTNEPSAWALDLKQLSNLNPMEKLSLGKLNPLARMAANATNSASTAASTDEGGPLKIVYFNKLTLQPLNGLLQVDDIGVANPQGFSSRSLVKLDQFKLEIDPDTIQSDILLIRDILINKPLIAYERRITTDNLKALQAEIERTVQPKGHHGEQADPKPEEQQQNENGQKVVIEHLLVKDGLVKAKLSIAPSIPIPLPDIELDNLGKADSDGSSGIEATDALAQIGSVFYDTIIGSVSGATGFGGDALKSMGALTLNIVTPAEKDGKVSSAEELFPEEPIEPGSTENIEATVELDEDKPERRRHRMPGRMF